MTGYGKAEFLFADHKTIVELRSVNSKQLDLTLKLAPLFRDREADIRALVSTTLERGKVDLSIYTQSTSATEAVTSNGPSINWAQVHQLVRDYCSEMVASHVPEVVMATFIRMAASDDSAASVLSDEEWLLLQKAIAEAMKAYLAFRIQEGESLNAMFLDRLSRIEKLLAEVEPYEKDRIESIRTRLMSGLEELHQHEKVEVDKNRLEAEMIYYLEKLDISEEKVRLANHIRYFRETLAAEGAGVGKKFGFISQEMGREINTLGSKSNQSDMQIIVVQMKDLLEQIKEQVLNVL